MRIFIEVPVWLGDTIMASVAVRNIISSYKGSEIIIFGSKVATQIYGSFSGVSKVVVDESKSAKNRWFWLYRKCKELGKFDLAISFRRQYSTRFLLFFLNAKDKFRYKRLDEGSTHQVKRYNDFAAFALKKELRLGDLALPFEPKKYEKKALGLNPGAAYGSAKRWYPKEFAKVAKALSSRYDIYIFGSPNEKEQAVKIENYLKEANVLNVKNLAGKTDIKSLCEHIGGLSLFITNDSGPLHIGAAYKVKTIAIFGPTIPLETNGWNNPFERIVKLDLPCQPCMKRVCPLKHHDCMKQIKARDVLEKVSELDEKSTKI